jgi:ubiquinone/menaquinone biosynthesis C-methylase UbiE
MPDTFAAFEREVWNQGRAAPYHHGVGAITSWAIPALLDAARVGPGQTVLDVATGPGYAAAEAADRGARAVGVDFSGDMLELAAGLHPGIDFRRADAAALPFEDASFDAAFANFLMPHAPDLPVAVRELARVVRPGGRVALTTWDPEPTTYVTALVRSVAAAGAEIPPELASGPSFFQYSADDEFASLLAGAGLTEPSVAPVRFTHRVADVDAFYRDLLAGTVRMGVVIAAQAPDVRERIHSGFRDGLQAWRAEGGYEIPCAAKLGAGTRP